ncbi:preprotein translocase subunit SecA [Candidatus Persebacteraceae bacterium Df01]|jgi:preprotein translocase subunit SecA|uniref:Protein translocase subunit SecA n=1 Tax=Candidatus Doriopsillibacter californiensis TaxID=2970740 RepID=A0ABT7QJC7_9GAMM|nr:preprotein translocase subunit SecA [Candidatus Persebacteraceae bacterium Df01]
MKNILSRVFGSRKNRQLATYRSRLAAVNTKTASLSSLDDAQLRAAYQNMRQRGDNGETLSSLLPEVFAVVREAASRSVGMRHFDAQLIGGMALFEGNIAEMKTGEGKTLAATLPVCLEAIAGKGVHVVTVNNYLARRDAEWMGALYRFLGLSVGINVPEASMEEKAAAYRCDIVYGTNNEFGFDYLRDNMRYDPNTRLQQALHYAIVDEVDSILIDEARTPLIISGEAGDNITVYKSANHVAAQFIRCENSDAPGDFIVDEKARDIHLTEDGFTRAESLFGETDLLKSGSLYDPSNLSLMHHLNAALKARHLYVRDRDYVVQEGQVIIVDEFTGRLMPGRRWGDNQHQAIEAKEGLAIQKENQTLASISFQNYFRLYKKLAGMTGTALTEAEEFRFIYGLEVVEIPTHKKMIRHDELDRVYRTTAGKYRSVLTDIRACAERGQPVLVGTTAIEDSEKLSQLLHQEKLPHEVLNAKQHEREAHIVAQAGRAGAITIATNMAGRGTDIVLGGNIEEERLALEHDESLSDDERKEKTVKLQTAWKEQHEQVLKAGGLKIIGTERHESRRIDNQLRGRAGRQGDPGASTFYLSFEDSLLRIFATKRVSSLMEKLNLDEDEAIEARMVSRTIENAQHKVESHNFDIRKQLLEYDDIANEQRRMIYEQREHILTATDMVPIAADLRTENLRQVIDVHLPPETPEEEWRATDLEKLLAGDYRLQLPIAKWLSNDEDKPREHFVELIINEAEALYAQKIAHTDVDSFNGFLRSLTLNIIDEHWRAHLSALDGLRLSIGLRGMAQKNPKQEYKREAFEMFEHLLTGVQSMAARVMYALTVRDKPFESTDDTPPPATPRNLQYRHDDTPAVTTETSPPPPAIPETEEETKAQITTFRRMEPKARRNDPCTCGSGKKYKQCCGKL